jgi:hypothetical protein
MSAPARRACREALDAALDRGRASCAEWIGAQWAAEHCVIGRPPRRWQVPGLGWTVPGQLLGLRVRGYTRTGSAASSHTTRPVPSRNMLYVRLELHVRPRFANVLDADLILHNDRAVTSPVKIAAPHQAI